MLLSETEKDILRVIVKSGKASKSEISNTIGFSIDYIELVGNYLIRKGYLTEYKRHYILTPEGEKNLYSMEISPYVKDKEFFDKITSRLAEDVARKVSVNLKASNIKRKTPTQKQKVSRYKEITPAERKIRNIQIKTECFLPVKDESVGLETNIDEMEIPIEKEKKGALDKSIKILKNIKRKK